MEFFTLVFRALQSSDLAEKYEILSSIDIDTIYFNHNSCVLDIANPSYANICKIAHPTRTRRPKGGNSNSAIAKILHYIAHIEYSAIDLGLDAMYRFRNLPLEYYKDFLQLTFEEIYHFSLLESLLKELGYLYGSFVVHDNLFNAMQKSRDLISRMALVHKGLEAMGLDANPFVRAKIESCTHVLKDRILNCLDIILRDEIGHVSRGAKWLDFAMRQENDTRSLGEILNNFREFNVIGRIPNIDARLKAGYSMGEIEELMLLNGFSDE